MEEADRFSFGGGIIRMLRQEEKAFATPYSKLASIYDFVMRHVDYVHWADYVESVLDRHRLLPTRMLDLACGTGTLTLELAARGYRMSGTDGCGEMLEVARRKAVEGSYDIPFHHRSFLDLVGMERHDCAVSLYDSVNYLMNLDDLAQMLNGVHEVVHRGGLFVFDLCTVTNSLRYFRNMREREKGDGFSYTRHSYYEDGIQYNEFKITFNSPKIVVHELHQQRIYALSDVEPVIEASPFSLEAAYDGFGFCEPTERSDRVHFVLRA